MNEAERLLAAIVEAPDDDAPRLVYADWLQAQGDPRGELIQLQCQLAAAPDDDRRRAIRIAENKLLAAHGAAWLAPALAVLPKTHELTAYKLELERGFIAAAKLTMDCVRQLDALWEVAPLLQTVRLAAGLYTVLPVPKPSLATTFASANWHRVRALEISLGGAGNAGARAVAAAPTLGELRSLELHLSVWDEGIGIFEPGTTELVLDDEGAAALAASPYLAKLETLILDGNRLTSAGVAALGRGPWRLRRLELGTNLLDAATLARSLEGPAFAELEVLGLGNTWFDAKAIAALVSSPALGKLRELDLEKCHLGIDGIEALCKALALPSLRRLRLERNALCDKGALAIAGCERFAQLTELEAGHNRMGHKAAVALSSSPHLANLQRLTLNEPRWKPETTALFAESPTLANAKIYLQGRLVGRKASKSTTVAKPTKPAKPRATSKPART